MTSDTKAIAPHPVEVSREPISAPLGWKGISSRDYPNAVIRLATVACAGPGQLLWAGVELLPAEIPPPPYRGVSADFGDHRVIFSRTAMSLEEGLNWYADAEAGRMMVPGFAFEIRSAPLGAEPPQPWLTLRHDLPFSPRWHLGTRLHRLVPLSEPDDAVRVLAEGMTRNNRFQRARHWLADRLHFDLLAYDDWLGTIVLVAPNPAVRSLRPRIVARTAAQETVEVVAAPRAGQGVDRLSIVFQERRAGALAWREEVRLDSLGKAATTVPATIDRLGYQLICADRGLLHDEEPVGFIRGVHVGRASEVRTRRVQPARRRQSEESPEPYETRVRDLGDPDPPGSAADALQRLARLQRLREDRSGEDAPAASPLMTRLSDSTFQVFTKDREEAVGFIRTQIRGARRRLWIVDPFFGPEDVLDFIYAASVKGVAVSVLMSGPMTRFHQPPVDGPPDVATNGSWLSRLIEDMRQPSAGFGEIDVRVTRGVGVHDRFLVVDDVVWHCGHSFNKVGTGDLSAMSRVPGSSEILQRLNGAFAAAVAFDVALQGSCAGVSGLMDEDHDDADAVEAVREEAGLDG